MLRDPNIAHIALSVSDLDRSEAWYRRLLDVHQSSRRTGPTWRRVILQANTVRLSLTAHNGTASTDRFDERRIGLDHIAIGCRDRTALDSWINHIDTLGLSRGPVVEAEHAHLFVCRDPDGIPVEFYWLI